jgi:subtilase family serine protease
MHWLKNWFSRKLSARSISNASSQSQKSKKRRHTFQPLVEQLEEKVLPSAVATPTYAVHYGHGAAHPAASSSPPSTALTPTQIRAAYGITGTGAGETIAIVDAYDDPSISADLSTFDAQFQINTPFTFIKEGQGKNGSFSTSTVPQANSGWAGEIELDVESAHAIAPAATILLVEAANANDSSLMAAVDFARNYSGVVAVSMSWGEGEYAGETADDVHFVTPSNHVGVTFFASSGDANSIGYPATSSHVVAVGGTNLSTDAAGDYLGESAWSAGGGGLSQVITAPSYQSGLVISNGTQQISANGMRAGPDVAYDADPNTGVAVYGSYGFGGWAQVGGTSAGAPAWAGLMALVDQARGAAGSMDGYTQTLPALYALPSTDFHDITSGSNGNSNGHAGPGFDLVTGRGTPVANLIIAGLSGNSGGTTSSPPSVTSIAAVPLSNTSATLMASGTEPSGDAALVYTWSLVSGPASVTVSSNGTTTSNSITATFTKAGTYNFQVTVTDPTTGLTATSTVSYSVAQVLTSVSVTPTKATLAVNATQQFSATALDQFGVAMATQPTFAWSVTPGAGTISASGLYTAPSTAATDTIQASVTVGGNTITGSTSVTVVNQSATTTTLTGGPITYTRRAAMQTLTIQVFPPPGSTTQPTGTVELIYNGTVLGTATLQIINGVATARFNIQYSANGNYTFTAQYMGSSTYQGSTSSPLTVTV